MWLLLLLLFLRFLTTTAATTPNGLVENEQMERGTLIPTNNGNNATFALTTTTTTNNNNNNNLNRWSAGYPFATMGFYSQLKKLLAGQPLDKQIANPNPEQDHDEVEEAGDVFQTNEVKDAVW